jgi:hypothetical protein
MGLPCQMFFYLPKNMSVRKKKKKEKSSNRRCGTDTTVLNPVVEDRCCKY